MWPWLISVLIFLMCLEMPASLHTYSLDRRLLQNIYPGSPPATTRRRMMICQSSSENSLKNHPRGADNDFFEQRTCTVRVDHWSIQFALMFALLRCWWDVDIFGKRTLILNCQCRFNANTVSIECVMSNCKYRCCYCIIWQNGKIKCFCVCRKQLSLLQTRVRCFFRFFRLINLWVT